MVESSNNVCISFTTHFVFVDENFDALVVGMIIFINRYRMPPMLCMTMQKKMLNNMLSVKHISCLAFKLSFVSNSVFCFQ